MSAHFVHAIHTPILPETNPQDTDTDRHRHIPPQLGRYCTVLYTSRSTPYKTYQSNCIFVFNSLNLPYQPTTIPFLLPPQLPKRVTPTRRRESLRRNEHGVRRGRRYSDCTGDTYYLQYQPLFPHLSRTRRVLALVKEEAAP